MNAVSSVQLDFVLNVGHIESEVTVAENAQIVNTTDASVGTVVDRQFVENLPLNGRSFQPLITLTPGVVLTAATESNAVQQVTATTMVPWLAVRQQAILAIQPFLNTFPLPNGRDLPSGFSLSQDFYTFGESASF